MKDSSLLRIHEDLLQEGYYREKYTARAFRMIPGMENPSILDVGCGAGVPTLELARLSNGEVTGIDTCQPYLDILSRKVCEQGLSKKIKVMNLSMFNMPFPEESFDIIWSEGSIFNIGFDRGLKEWRRFIKSRGFLVVEEMVWLRPEPPQEIRDYFTEMYPGIRTVEENLEHIPSSLYDIIGHFSLSDGSWWVAFYDALEQRLRKLRKKYRNNAQAVEILEREQIDVDMYKKYKRWYGSAYFILQKTEG